MTTSDWLVIGGIAMPIVSGIAGWGVVRVLKWKGRVDRRLAGVLMEEKHDQICTKRTAELQRSVDQLRSDMDRRHVENREALAEIRDSITGTHKQLVDILLNQRSGGR